MEERIIVVWEIATKQTKAGQDYLAVKGKDGMTYNIFDQASFPVFEVDRAVKLTGEKSGKYFNTQKAEGVANIMEQEAAVKVAGLMGNVDNRVKALNCATAIIGSVIQHTGEAKTANDVVVTAKVLAKYLDTGE